MLSLKLYSTRKMFSCFSGRCINVERPAGDNNLFYLQVVTHLRLS